MKHLAASISAFMATLVAVGRLFMFGQSYTIAGVGRSYGTIFDYLFQNRGTLDPGVGIQALFSTVVLWMAVFSTLWLILSLIPSRRQ